MTPKQKRLVQISFDRVKPIADVAATLFYSCLFDLDPGLEDFFTGDSEEQGRRVMRMIGLAVKGLDHLDQLVPTLLALGSRSAAYGVGEHDYKSVRKALLWTLDRALGPAFTPEMKAAWIDVYELLAETMKLGARSAVLVTVRSADQRHLHRW